MKDKMRESSSNSSSDRKRWGLLWSLSLPPKIKVFIWKVCHKAIPSLCNLVRRKVVVEVGCRFCGGEAESDAHALWWCPKAVEVWVLTALWERIELFRGIPRYDVLRGWMCMVLWGIWFNRNAGVHSGVVRSAEVLLSWISGLLVEFKDTHRALAASKGGPTTAATVWSCPPPGMLKLNTDVAVKPGNDCVGVGAVIRDSSGLVVAAVSKTLLGCFSAETGEMLALREGLLLARNLGLNVQLIEVDACNVVSSVLGSDSCCGENGLIVLDIKALLKVVRFVKCQAISRKSNGVAHNLASLALSFLKERYWHNVCLSCIFPCL
ncbi:hypothetical protein ACOSP7_022746 [Xanthoceras sorbifolium]